MTTMTLLAAAQMAADTLTGANPVLTPVASGEPQMNLWEMACKGGWIMVILAIMSVIAFYIFFERAVTIRKAGKEDPLFMDRIRDYIKSGEIKSAINYCRITNTPSARMIEKGITRMGRPVADVQAAIENTGNIEVAKLENGLPIVATISGGAPMIGFLGTVTGMVQAFWEMANAGNNIDITLPGIWPWWSYRCRERLPGGCGRRRAYRSGSVRSACPCPRSPCPHFPAASSPAQKYRNIA